MCPPCASRPAVRRWADARVVRTAHPSLDHAPGPGPRRRTVADGTGTRARRGAPGALSAPHPWSAVEESARACCRRRLPEEERCAPTPRPGACAPSSPWPSPQRSAPPWPAPPPPSLAPAGRWSTPADAVSPRRCSPVRAQPAARPVPVDRRPGPRRPPGTRPDLYDRDRTYWGRLEPSKGSYDFTTIENGLKDVGARRPSSAFASWRTAPAAGWSSPRGTCHRSPPVVPKDSQRRPAVEQRRFLSGWEKLWAALGAKYGNDKRLGYVDVGGFGKYGEWMPAGDHRPVGERQAHHRRRREGLPEQARPAQHRDRLMHRRQRAQRPPVGPGHLPQPGMRSDCLGNPTCRSPRRRQPAT